MIKVKVCGMTDPENIREIAEAKPDFIGFIFYPLSKRYVGPEPDLSLFSIVPPGIYKTGVFVDEDPGTITNIAGLYGLDVIQLHGDESPGYCDSLRNKGLLIVKAIEINLKEDILKTYAYSDVCDYYLFDTKTGSNGGSGLKFNWSVLDNYKLGKPFFLGGGIAPEDVSEIKGLNHKSLFAVDINSRFETGPGIKDRKKVFAFINEIRH